MLPFKRILFPVDFSDSSSALAPDVIAIAQKFAASVIVLHAFELVPEYNLAPRVDAPFGPEPGEFPYVPSLQELREIREGRLREFVRSHLAGIEARTIVEDGDPARVIESVARQEKIDLVMMSTRGKGRFRRMLMGSLTAKVLHDVECPVYTSPHEPGEKPPSPDGFRTILCAVSMEPESEALLRFAASLARAFESRICLVHIHTAGKPGRHEATAAEVRKAFEQALAKVEDGSVATNVRILNAAVPEGIRQAAIEEAADLVVVGRGHARSSISRIWSQMYTIIRESPCPVVSV